MRLNRNKIKNSNVFFIPPKKRYFKWQEGGFFAAKLTELI